MQYSDEKQRWYNSYVPTRIYLAKEDEEETFVGLEDENEINEVFEEFKERNKEIFDFID